uniref:Uncharacterized protein n=1 Tax=Branchiostoma floridae TaxID=7739 RepID=C3ZXP7_BRAFL|eukprot:XP_002586699.1 hypothetical protein BRAFLDRAFT_131130 [Branchiostoma floridae]
MPFVCVHTTSTTSTSIHLIYMSVCLDRPYLSSRDMLLHFLFVFPFPSCYGLPPLARLAVGAVLDVMARLIAVEASSPRAIPSVVGAAGPCPASHQTLRRRRCFGELEAPALDPMPGRDGWVSVASRLGWGGGHMHDLLCSPQLHPSLLRLLRETELLFRHQHLSHIFPYGRAGGCARKENLHLFKPPQPLVASLLSRPPHGRLQPGWIQMDKLVLLPVVLC